MSGSRLPLYAPTLLAAPLLLAALLLLAACDSGGGPLDPGEPEMCSGFADWQTSPYVLPYPVGLSYFLDQANCSGFGHRGYYKYGYDFLMDIGSPVTAARAGVVLFTAEGTADGDRSGTNLITVEHADGTVALYSHLTRNGVFVEVGDMVAAGQRIGLSGDTGDTGGTPHLHFSVHQCGDLQGLPGVFGLGPCPTLPVTFRNAEAKSGKSFAIIGIYSGVHPPESGSKMNCWMCLALSKNLIAPMRCRFMMRLLKN